MTPSREWAVCQEPLCENPVMSEHSPVCQQCWDYMWKQYELTLADDAEPDGNAFNFWRWLQRHRTRTPRP